MDETKALKFLESHRLAVMSTISQDGKPHGAVMYYLVDPDFTFYFVTKTGTSKYKSMLLNPNASITIWDEEQSETAQIDGIISEVDSTETGDRVIHTLMSKSDIPNWPPPIARMKAGDFVVMALTPTHIQVGDFKKFHEGTYFTHLDAAQENS